MFFFLEIHIGLSKVPLGSMGLFVYLPTGCSIQNQPWMEKNACHTWILRKFQHTPGTYPKKTLNYAVYG